MKMTWISLAFLINFCLSGIAFAQSTLIAEDLTGDWSGVLKAGAREIPLILHIATDNGALAATLDSSAQNALDIPVSADLNGDIFSFTVPANGAAFEGRIEDPSRITGTFTQRGQSLPLLFRRDTAKKTASILHRPQTPKEPFPYEIEEIAFPGGSADVKLSGTLTKPHGPGPYPAAITIGGSGANDRNGAHQRYHLIADRLTRAGFAVLRYDDRGTARSTGDYRTATSEDFAADVAVAMTALTGQVNIDPERIALIGHSEGGTVAPMTAHRFGGVAALVLLAAPAVEPRAFAMEQVRLQALSRGESEDQIAQRLAFQTLLIDLAQQSNTLADALSKLEPALDGLGLPDDQKSTILAEVQARATPQQFFLGRYDPGPTLEALSIPVLALFAEKDVSVSALQNAPAMKARLSRSASPDWSVETFPGLNHLFQTAETGGKFEYNLITETMNEAVLARITGWLTKILNLTLP